MISLCTGSPPSPPRGITLINGMPAATTNDTARNLPPCPTCPCRQGQSSRSRRTGWPLPLGSQTVVYAGGSATGAGRNRRSRADPVPLPTSAIVTISKGTAGAGSLTHFLQRRASYRRFRFRQAGPYGVRRCQQGVQAGRPPRNDPAPQLHPESKVLFHRASGGYATGRVMTDAVDFELPGPISLVFERNYSSGWSRRTSPVAIRLEPLARPCPLVRAAGRVCRLARMGAESFSTGTLPNAAQFHSSRRSILLLLHPDPAGAEQVAAGR